MSNQPELGRVPNWDLPDRMRKGLRHSGVSVQAMAEYLEVSRNTVGNWINGHTSPPATALRLWALRCGVPYEWLKTGQTPDGDDPSTESGTTHQYPSNVVALGVRPIPALLDRDAA